MRLRHDLPPLALAASLLALAGATERLSAQATACKPGVPEVREVSFSGNASLPDRALRAVIETRASSAFRRVFRVVGARQCLPDGALLRDVTRLMLFYRRKGYPRATVDTAVRGDRSEEISVHFDIREGDPIVVDSVVLRGIADSALRARLGPALQLRAGEPLDHFALDESTAAVLARLRRLGHLRARARPGYRVDSAAFRAIAWIDVTAGPRVRIGEVRVDARGVDGGEPRVPPGRVRRLTGLQVGEVLGSQQLNDARSGLDAAGLFDEIQITVDSLQPAVDGDAIADLDVRTLEGKPHQLRLRAGYATLDCFRLQLQGSRSGAFRRPGRLELTANLTKLAVGHPLDFAPGLCSDDVRADPYSRRLNYYFGGTYSQAASGWRAVTRSVSVYTERRSEYLAYLRTTYLGLSAAIARRLGRKWTSLLSYDLSYARTEAEPAVLCATFSACVAADREQFTEALPFGLLSVVVSYDNTDIPTDPTRGQSLRGEVRVAPEWLGTATRQQVIGARTTAAAYFPLSPRTVLATRVSAGVVNTLADADFIPQGERLFAGGATTVRGFRQNEIGSRVYIADSVRLVLSGSDTLVQALPPDSTRWRAVPAGGNTAIVANVELRIRPPVLTSFFQFVAFLDGGMVWNRGEPQLTDEPFFLTPGVGARLSTPIGPIRLDAAYNSYAPPAGPAYRDAALGYATAPLYCVSPGNTLPLTGFNQFDAEGRAIPPVQAAGPCPPSFGPSRPRGFLDRMTIVFSVGQAF
ncbi:MAG TPA: BamA/TamA family outer membrane protein [Gemmatimonadaceae bacterium]|nr:BamA/TamA family outer membrane protein [Gemmatimonadaceae bacterium]